MNKYHITADSKNIIKMDGKTIIIIKNGHKIKKEIPFTEFEICGFGNNGNIALKTSDGIFVDNIYGGKDPYFIVEFSPMSLAGNNSKLGKVILNNKGSMLCVEKLNYRNNFLDNLVNRLGRNAKHRAPAQRLINHQFVIYNLTDNSKRTAFIFPLGGKEKNKISWNISPNFKYMAMVEDAHSKNKEMLYIVNLALGTILAKIEISSTHAKNLNINNLGVCMFEVNGSLKEYVIITSNGKVMRFKKDSSANLMHFGSKIMVFKKNNKPHLIIKDMDEKLICEADLAPLEAMKLDYNVYFNEEDDIDLILTQDDRIKVMRCNLNSFHYDLKRWKTLADKKNKSNGETAKEDMGIIAENITAEIKGNGFKPDYDSLSQSLYKSLMEKKNN